MKRTFNRRRQHAFPANPKKLEDLDDIPDEFKTTLKKNKKFLIYDSYFDDDEDDDETRRKIKNSCIFIETFPTATLSVLNMAI